MQAITVVVLVLLLLIALAVIFTWLAMFMMEGKFSMRGMLVITTAAAIIAGVLSFVTYGL